MVQVALMMRDDKAQLNNKSVSNNGVTDMIAHKSESKEKMFNVYMNSLKPRDRKAVESSLNTIINYPFVDEIEFENYSTPTIIVKTSEINSKYEDEIYAIEYNLLRETNADIDFYIQAY